MSLKNFIYFFIFCFSLDHHIYSFTIMIDPIGNAQYTGREIEDTFERVVTLQCAQKLKEMIRNNFDNAQVIITRTAGEKISERQNASFANRMNVDLYLAISLYHQSSIPSNVAIFYYRQSYMDQYHKYDPYNFYHITEAHLIKNTLSMNIAKMFIQTFQNKNINTYFLPIGYFGIPCIPLFGVTSPAIYIEAGLKNKNDWHHLTDPIIATIKILLS